MKSKTKRGTIQRAMRRSHVINLAMHCKLCKRQFKRYMNRLYDQGELGTY